MVFSPWRLIRSEPMTGALNMAMDEALLEEVIEGRSGPVLRLYRWSPPAVSLGYSQRSSGAVDPSSCRMLGIDVVRRITGGRAVLHDREVTYAVIAPEAHPLFGGGILETYHRIAQVLQEIVLSFGIAAELAPRRPLERMAISRACFVSSSSHELVYQGCKMTGSSQKRQGGAFLQHGSIPVDLDLERLYRALHGGTPESVSEGGRQLARRIGWLNRWLETPVTLQEVEERLIHSFSGSWGISFSEGEPSLIERKRAEALARSRYGNPDWIFRL